MVSATALDVTHHQKLALVIPCFNEAKRLRLPVYAEFLEQHPGITCCFVNDGSTDETLQMVTAFAAHQAPDAVRVVALNQNSGKAEAVRQGVLAMLSDGSLSFDTLGFWDADLATPLSELDRFLHVFKQDTSIQAVVGFRKKESDAKIQRSFSRKVISAIMHTIIQNYFGLPIHDTQCGAKLFKASLASKIFADPFVARWVFDIELFLRVKHVLGPDALLQNVEQLHLKAWHDVPGTKLKLQDVPKIFLELVRIKSNYRAWVEQNNNK